MLRIGIAGGIGSGKSVVARIIHSMGYPVFYSDEVAKTIMDTDLFVKKRLTALLGVEIYSDVLLNRKLLAAKIFTNPELKDKVNAIIHPAVRIAFDEFCAKQKSPLVFNEAAILFETGTYKNFDKMILVTADESLRIRRTIQRDNANESEIRKRIDNQWTDERKIPLADFVIQNDDQQAVLKQILYIIGELENEAVMY